MKSGYKRRRTKELAVYAALLMATLTVLFFCIATRADDTRTYAINDLATLKTELSLITERQIIDDGTSISSITLTDSDDASNALICLSNTTPSLYNNAEILIHNKTIDLTSSHILSDGRVLTFQGLGSDTAPFTGRLLPSVESSTSPFGVTLAFPLFYGISPAAELHPLSIAYVGANAEQAVFAENVIGDIDDAPNEWVVTVSFGSTTGTGNNSTGGFIERISSKAKINLTISNVEFQSSSYHSYIITNSDGGAGVICNELASGASLEITAYNFTHPNATGNFAVNIAGAAAGMFVGKASDNSSISFPDGFSMQNEVYYTINGNTAGGLIGEGTDCTINCTTAIPLAHSDGTSCVSIIGNGTSPSVGGAIGKLTLSQSFTLPQIIFPVNDLSLTCSTNEPCFVGGVVGSVCFTSSDAVCTIATVANMTAKLNITGTAGKTIAGGVVGYVHSSSTNANKNPLLAINNPKVEYKTSAADYVGGIVGRVGSTASDGGVCAKISSASVTSLANLNVNGNHYGGAVGDIKNKAVVSIDGFELNNSGKAVSGGGIVGVIGDRAALCLSGTIDLRNCTYNGNSLGQIVGEQSNSLVFTKNNINLLRGKSNGSTVNDIGNYGNVLRLGGNLSNDLYYIDNSTNLIVRGEGMYTINDNTIIISDANQFAYLVTDTQNNWNVNHEETSRDNRTLLGHNITLNTNIDLSDTGISSFHRDIWYSAADEVYYSGTFNGNNHTLTLTSGAAWGTTQDGFEYLDGRIISKSISGSSKHNDLGLFVSTRNATFNNITVDGTFTFYSEREDAKSGVFVAYSKGSLTFNNVAINIDAYINTSGTRNMFGMFFGNGVKENNVNYTLTVDNCTLSGSITSVDNMNNQLYVGGITASAESYNSIKLTSTEIGISMNCTGQTFNCGLVAAYVDNKTSNNMPSVKVSELIITGNITYNNTGWKDAGGLFGYSWIANVNFVPANSNPALSVGSNDTEAFIHSESSLNLGGLCWRGLGYWNVPENGIVYTNFNIQNHKGHLGCIIADGRARNSDGDRALYLELSHINSYDISGLTITRTDDNNASNFYNTGVDELVRWSIANHDSGESVVSIATAIDPLTGREELIDTSYRNTYINKTKNSNGDSWSTNGDTRYYYNLHRYRNSTTCGGEQMLIWSVYHYADAAIKQYFPTAKDQDPSHFFWMNRLGIQPRNGKTQATVIDLTGYSYYPIDYNLEACHINAGVTIKFNNECIESFESGTLSTLSTTSQHYMMHFGVFRNFSGTLTIDKDASDAAAGTMNPITFTGNVGRDSTYSGALICGTSNRGTATKKTILSINGLKLKDLCINNYSSGYAPLLINKVDQYNTLTMKNIFTENDNVYTANTASGSSWYAAGSLIGNVGSQTAKGIVLSFSDMRIDSRTTSGELINAYGTYRTIFNQSTFLYSFRYEGDSIGVYNFNMDEDWEDASNHIFHVTYGKEITESVKNENNQFCYYDNDIAINPAVFPTGTSNLHAFANGFLPYVYQTEVNSTYSADYHEIDVNVKIYLFDIGCGTYGHPYAINEGGQLETLMQYFISQKPKNGFVVCICELNDGINNTLHNNITDHMYYIYASDGWYEATNVDGIYVQSQTAGLDNDIILTHLQSGYYSIADNITLGSAFYGLGTESVPFCGVIIGNNHTVTLKASTVAGLIGVSGGCVIKDVNLVYNTSSILLDSPDAPEKGKLAKYFGGVIGQVCGGESVIDDVSVTFNNASIVLSGNGTHLMTVGGLVGVVHNGGVILRGNNTVTDLVISGISTAFNENNLEHLYCNPYVGRVLDSYVFSEGTEFNNTNKNYNIPCLNTSNSFSVNIDTDTAVLGDGQDLYILSCLSLGGINGKFRGNATYNGVGTLSNASDFALAKAEDVSLAPYIARKYVVSSNASSIVPTVNGGTLIIEMSGDCDVSDFGTAFAGIGGRYKDNGYLLASLDGGNHTVTLSKTLVEYKDDNFISSSSGMFNYLSRNGTNKVLNITNLSLSGSVSAQIINNDGTLTYIDGKGTGMLAGRIQQASTLSNCSVAHATVTGFDAVGGFYGITDSEKNITLISTISDCVINDSTVCGRRGTGGMIGVANDVVVIDFSTETSMSNCTIKNSGIALTGQWDSSHVGGLVGSAENNATIGNVSHALTLTDFTVDNHIISHNGSIGGLLGTSKNLTVRNVVLDNILIRDINNGKACSGGIVGYSQESTMNITNVSLESGTIDGTLFAGGFVGSIARVTCTIGNCRIATCGNVSVNVLETNNGAVCSGGLFGDISNNSAQSVSITDLIISENESNYSLTVSAKTPHNQHNSAVGGIAGQLRASNVTLNVNDCVINNLIVHSYSSAGGLVGRVGASSASTLNIADSYIGNSILMTVANWNSAHTVGGLAGYINNNFTVNGRNVILNSIVFDRAEDSTFSPNANSILTNAGAWVGKSNSIVPNLYLVGVSVLGNCMPAKDAADNYNGYIIYADVYGVGASTVSADTSPTSSVIAGGALYGDAVIPDHPMRIYNDALTDSSSIVRNGYSSSVKNADLPEKISTYNTLQGASITNDLSVLLVDKNSSSEVDELISNYIDLITNGGASSYENVRGSLTVDIMTYKHDNGSFEAIGDRSIIYEQNSSHKHGFKINRGKNDSGENQFTLLTLTFRTANTELGDYILYIPVLVNKPINVSVSINILQGTVFKDSEFANKYLVLNEYGKKSTVRVEYSYDYSWGEALEGLSDDASLLDWYYQKNLLFSVADTDTDETSLPQGTIITLIDPQQGDIAYTTVLDSKIYRMNLLDLFDEWTPTHIKDLCYMEESAEGDELWVECNEDSGVFELYDHFYRLANNSDVGTTYKIVCKESYLIVIETPQATDNVYRAISFRPDSKLHGKRENGQSAGFQNHVMMTTNDNQLKIYTDFETVFSKNDEYPEGSIYNNESGFVAFNNTDNSIHLTLSARMTGDATVTSDTMERYLRFLLNLNQTESSRPKGFEGSIIVNVEFVVGDIDSPSSERFGYTFETLDGLYESITIPFARSYNGAPINLVSNYMTTLQSVDIHAIVTLLFTQDGSMETFPIASAPNNACVSLSPMLLIADNESFLAKTKIRLPDEYSMLNYYRNKDITQSLEFNPDFREQLGINPGATGENENGVAIINATGIISGAIFEEDLDTFIRADISLRLSKKDNNSVYIDLSETEKYIDYITVGGLGLNNNNALFDNGVYTWTVYPEDSYGEMLSESGDVLIVPVELGVYRTPRDSGFIYSSYRLEMTVTFYTIDNDSTSTVIVGPDHIAYLIAKISEDYQ